MSSTSPAAKTSDWSAPESGGAAPVAERIRFSPRWMTATIGAVGVLLLYVGFPGWTLDWYMSKAERNDAVLTLLLRAYERAEPGNVGIRIALLRQLMAEGRHAEAERTLAPLFSATDRTTRVAAFLLEFDLAERQVMAMEPNSAERKEGMARLSVLLERMSREGIRSADLTKNVRRLLAADIEAKNEADAQRLEQIQSAMNSQREGERAAENRGTPGATESVKAPLTPVEEARRLLGEGKHVAAAQAYLRAMQVAGSPELKRRYFLDALRTYQAASKFNEAFAAAEAHGGAFMRDIVVVEFLVRLGRAANRPDLAERYVRVMLRISGVGHIDRQVHRGWSLVAGALDWIVPNAHAAEEDLVITLPFDEDRYLLAFEVFLANKNQAAARRLAAEAVRRVPKDPTWRKRYAQICEWDGQAHLALSQWLIYAELTDADDGWNAVKRLAAPLFAHDVELKLLAREYQRNEGNVKTLRAMVELHERLGTTDEAIVLVQAARRKHGSREILLLLAELADRVGRDALALEAYDAVVERFGADVPIAMRQATIAFSMRRLDEAWRYIQRGQAKAGASDMAFWRMFASLASLKGQFDDAARGLRILVDNPQAQARDVVELIEVLSGRYPIETARVATFGYERFGRIDWLLLALQVYSDQRDWSSFKRVLSIIKEADIGALATNANFLMQRATYHQAIGSRALALRDLSAVIAISPLDAGMQQNVLWMTLSMRQMNLLRTLVVKWNKDAQATSDLWAPFAAAYAMLDEPRKAVHFYHKLVERKSDDYLLLLAYAGALEQEGDRERAWRIRRHAWTRLRKPEVIAAASDGAELKRAHAQLAMTFAPGDDSAKLIAELLHTSRSNGSNGSNAPAVKELALAWLLSIEAHDAAHVWYLQQYARDLATAKDHPYWAQLAIALAREDHPVLATLLDNQADLLPMSDRIEANERLGRMREALGLAGQRFERFPDNSDAHERFTSLAMEDPRRVVVETKHARIGALQSVSASGRVAVEFGGLRLGLGVERHAQSTRDQSVLMWVPAIDQTLETSARLKSRYGNLGLSLARRHALAPHTGLRLEWSKQAERWSATATGGLRQPSFETTLLRLGGMKDTLEASASYRLSKYDTVSSMVRFDRFASQNRVRLGAGRVASLEASHAFRLEYPDLRVRAFVATNRFSATGAMDASFAAFMPDGGIPASDVVIPRRFTIRGVGITAGSGYERRYSRGWRPFADLAVVRNNVFGSGVIARFGAGGSVFGPDNLSIYFNYSRGTRGASDVVREIGLRYAW